jgi:hypothetical protein
VPRHNVGHFKGERARAHFLSVYQTAMAQLPPVRESADVPTSFGTIRAYRFDGPSAGPPVVLLPGGNASTPMWRVNIPALLQHRTVFRGPRLGRPLLKCVERHFPVPRNGALQPDGQQIAANARMVAQGLEAPIRRVMGLPLLTKTERAVWTAGDLRERQLSSAQFGGGSPRRCRCRGRVRPRARSRSRCRWCPVSARRQRAGAGATVQGSPDTWRGRLHDG